MKSLSSLTGAALLVIATVLLGVTPAGALPGPGSALGARSANGNEDGLGELMLVLDSSGSMKESTPGGKSRIDAAKSALNDVIKELPADAEVGLRVFGAKVFSRKNPGSCQDSQRVVDIGTDNRDELSDAVSSYKPFGETPIPYALREAAKDLGDDGARSIVLVSDGESTCDPDPCKVAADLAKQGIDLQINVVGLSVSGDAREQLQCIADKGNGTYYDADDADDIEASLTRVAERALRPFVLTGEELAGGTEENPTPVDVGTFTDTLAPEGIDGSTKSFVFTREQEGTTLRASAITQGEPGDDGLDVEILDPEGERCDIDGNIRQIDVRSVVGTAATASSDSFTASSDSDCGAPGDYRITVERSLGKDRAVPYGLRVTEEPPITDVGFIADAEADPKSLKASGQPEEVVGGASFANAPQIGSGSWSSTIVPGEASLFAIPMEFGQSARISVTYPKANAATRDAIGPFPGLSLTRVTTYSPMQAELTPPRDAEFSESVGDEKVTLTSATPPISRALEDSSADYSMVGDYYLSVSLMRQDYSIEFPYTITVEIGGDAQPGPTYADGATWSVAEGAVYPGADEKPDAEPSQDAAGESAADDDGSAMTPTVGIVVGAAGLVTLVAAMLMWRRHRRT